MLDHVYSATWKEATKRKYNVETSTTKHVWPTALAAKTTANTKFLLCKCVNLVASLDRRYCFKQCYEGTAGELFGTGKFACIRYFQRIGINAIKSEKKLIHFQSDVFAAVDVIDAKTLYRPSRRSHVFVCEQKPYPVWFSCRRKSCSVECEQSLSVLSWIFKMRKDWPTF